MIALFTFAQNVYFVSDTRRYCTGVFHGHYWTSYQGCVPGDRLVRLLNIITQGATGCQRISHIERTGLRYGNFEKNPYEVPSSCFVGVV